MTPTQNVIRRALDANEMEHVDSPRDLFEHIAFSCKGHEDFRLLLDKCPPEKRSRAYTTLRPLLGFRAKPLDVYVAESGAIADAKQLPTVTADGKLLPWRKTELKSDDYIAQKAVDEAMAKHHLRVVCPKCTKEATFSGATKEHAIFELRNAGWTYDICNGGREICPDCPGGKSN